MSIRMTYDWALYEIASKIEDWEQLCRVQFTFEEKECLCHYLKIYKKHLDLHKQIRELKQQLPPPPQINEVTKAYKELCQESERIEKEINSLVESAPLQNVLSYRFRRKPLSEQVKQETKIETLEENQKTEVQKENIENRNDKTFFPISFSKRFAAVISILLCVFLYFALLTTVFSNKVNTYICYTQSKDDQFHDITCWQLQGSSVEETTVFHVSDSHVRCSYCKPSDKITITDRNYIIPIFISVPISAAVFLLLTYKKK